MQAEHTTVANQKGQLTLKNTINPSQLITLDLNKWKLLCSSGAHWIFATKVCRQEDEHSGDQKAYKTNKYDLGRYVMRMRKSKKVEKVIKGKVGEIAKRLREQGQEETLGGQKENGLIESLKEREQKAIKLEKPKTQLVYKKALSKTAKPNSTYDNTLNSLINIIYTQFLSQCISPSPSPSSVLPLLSQSLVRPSPKYMVEETPSPIQASLHDSDNNIRGFAKFIVREVMCYQLMNGKDKVAVEKESLRGIVDKEMVLSPFLLEEENLVKEQLAGLEVSFELNQLFFQPNLTNIHQPTQSHSFLPHDQDNSPQSRKLFSVFQFKPKTILPDIYTDEFIRHYTQNSNHPPHPNNQFNNNFTALDYQKQIRNILEESFFVSNGEKDLSKNKLKIQSTRWFKKNCLSNNHNNHNPLCFFTNCLMDQDIYLQQKQQPINFNTKTHLKLQKVINPKQHTNNQTLPKPITSPSQLHSTIINHITSKSISQKRSPSINSHIISQQQKLSLMEEILALQLIDLGDEKYCDVLEIGKCVEGLRDTLEGRDGCLNSGKEVQLTMNEANYQQISCMSNHNESHLQTSNFQNNSPQHLYPTNVLSIICSLFRAQVYNRSKTLSQLLHTLILTNQTIQSSIISAFNLRLNSQHSNLSQLNRIKHFLYRIVRFLIALTWKDVSVMVQALTDLDEQQHKLQILSTQHPLINKTEIINCAIIDYGIKTTQNICKNLQKQHQFLSNYQLFDQNKKNHKL